MSIFNKTQANFGQYLETLRNLKALRAYTARVKDGDSVLVAGANELGDSSGGVYVWSEKSTASDNNNSVIKPDRVYSTGRWLLAAGSQVSVLSAPNGASLIGYGTSTIAQALDAAKKFDSNMPLYAGNYGLIDDPNVGTPQQLDQSAALQAFLDLCLSQWRIAHFGKFRIGISKQINVGTGMLFERMSFSASGEGLGQVGLVEPGIYPSGDNYTALKVTGVITGFCVTVVGHGYATTDAAGNILTETRPNIVGIQFGDNVDVNGQTMIVSRIDFARVVNMRGTGIRVLCVFDSNFDKLHTETCGSLDAYAIEVTDAGSFSTTNESVFNYMQAEFARGKAIYVSPRTLSCTFNKIHSERASGKVGVPLWVLGGASNTYISVRMQDVLGNGHCDTYAIDSTFIGMRAENITVKVNASSGKTAFISCTGTFTASTNQNGTASFYSCAGAWENIGSGFNLRNCSGTRVRVGFNNNPADVVIDSCVFDSVAPDTGQAVATFTIMNSRITTLTPGAATYVTSNSMINSLSAPIGYCQFHLVDSSINGNVTVDTAMLNLVGNYKINGNLTLVNSKQSLATAGGTVTGTVSGWSAPTVNNQYLISTKGMQSVNLTPAVSGTSPNQYILTGWVYDGTKWVEMRALTGS